MSLPDGVKDARWLATMENVSDSEAAQLVLTGRSIDEIKADADALRKRIADGVDVRCPTCNGNDANAPCAYPEGGQPGCLRDKRLGRNAGVIPSEGASNG